MSQQINLFNPLFQKEKKLFSALNMLQALSLIFVGAFGVSFYASYQLTQTKTAAATLSARLSVAEADLVNFTATATSRKPNGELKNEIKKKQEVLMSMQKALDTLESGDMGNTKGYSEYFRAFSHQIVDGLWLTGVSLLGAGNEVGLRGRTLHPELVAVYIGKLKHESSMQGKSFATLEMETPLVLVPPKDASVAAKPVSRPENFTEFTLRTTESPKQLGLQGAKTE